MLKSRICSLFTSVKAYLIKHKIVTLALALLLFIAIFIVLIFEGIAIALSFMAVIAAISSLIITSKSLELTRATTRPFLTLKSNRVKMTENGAEITMVLTNVGSLPADTERIQVTWCTTSDELNGEQVVAQKDYEQATRMPQQSTDIRHTFDEPRIIELIKVGRMKVYVNIEYRHRLIAKDCSTSLSFSIRRYLDTNNYYFRMNPEECSWD